MFKVCESEMLLKNKLTEHDEDIDIDINKTEDIDISKTEDIDINKTEDKDEGTDKDMLIQVFRYLRQWHGKKNGIWKRKKIVWVFWNNGHVSELCKKWIYLNGKYAYTRFEELRIHSGEVIFTREHKATTSKDKSNTYIDIDDLKMFKDFSTSDKTTFKTKTKDKDKDKNKTKTEDKDKTTPKTRTKTEDKDILDKIN